ncbi:MAG TPA: hypothetical protein VL326_36650 [Kofleriaceae bacterium]|nr:hypothetical protein [Kofleriaceae bacterium]
MRSISYLLFAAVLLLNPISGCEYFAGYDYGAKEMKAAVAGTWTVKTKNGHEVTFKVDVGDAKRHSSRGWIPSAAACSHRSMISTAEACMDVTEMKLTLVAVEGDAPTEARFGVYSTHFTQGELSMRIGDEYVSAQVSPTGKVLDDGDATVVHTL